MINKKILFGLIIISFLGACSSPTAMIGPAYTLSSTGSIYNAGLTYGSNEFITQYTGKTPIENLKTISSVEDLNSKNIQKQTLESEDFYQLVKGKIEKTGSLINLSNQ
tara:strand:+ start:257 stop:580 length:324 start_codon:yes stop_codon:yes gene_type:complete